MKDHRSSARSNIRVSRRSLLPSIAAALLAPFALDAEEVPHTRTYSYVGIDGNEHQILAHFPSQLQPDGQRPGFIFFHGGGWKSGDLKQGKVLCEYLASRGVVALTANYSMHAKGKESQGESRKRICVIDAKTVIRWVKQNAGDLGIDPERLIVSGASAGAHIGVLQMMDERFNGPDDPEGIDTQVQAFVLLAAAFTFPEDDRTPEVNVFQHVEKPFPPTLFIVGETDRWAKAAQTLAGQLASRPENEIEFWVAPEMGHMFFRSDEAWYTTTKLRIDQFLTKLGFLTGEPSLQFMDNESRLRRVAF